MCDVPGSLTNTRVLLDFIQVLVFRSEAFVLNFALVKEEKYFEQRLKILAGKLMLACCLTY
jgi:hypothetical protein